MSRGFYWMILQKVSQFMSRAARLNEAFSVVRRVPVVRPALPPAGLTQWPVMSLRWKRPFEIGGKGNCCVGVGHFLSLMSLLVSIVTKHLFLLSVSIELFKEAFESILCIMQKIISFAVVVFPFSFVPMVQVRYPAAFRSRTNTVMSVM